MDDRYALLLLAMSMDEAKAKLGFPPNSNPSEQEIKQAYREKVRERMRAEALPGHHTDDSDPNVQALKELNVAKDILDGKAAPGGRPTYRRGPVEDDAPSPSPKQPQYKPPPSITVTFDEATSKAGIPSGVEWLFVTPMQRSKAGWSGNSSGKSSFAIVAYGRTDSQHVFLAALNKTEYSDFVLGGYSNNIWTAKSFEYPIKGDDGTNPAWLYGKVVKALKDIGFDGRFNSKVIDGKGWVVKERLPTGSEVSIKHWLVNSGQVAGDAASVAGRKQVVELIVEQSSLGQPKPGYYPEPHKRSNFWDGKYHGNYYKLTLGINGRPYVLNEADTTKFLGLNRPLDAIFGTYYYDGSKKVLTRMPKGKKILAWMGENFTGLPDEAQQALKAAADQMKG